MSREITSHTMPGLNQRVRVEAMDEPAKGQPNSSYLITIKQWTEYQKFLQVKFQNGEITEEANINGVTEESLLAVVLDRLQGLPSNRETSLAITKLEEVLMWLKVGKERTFERK